MKTVYSVVPPSEPFFGGENKRRDFESLNEACNAAIDISNHTTGLTHVLYQASNGDEKLIAIFRDGDMLKQYEPLEY